MNKNLCEVQESIAHYHAGYCMILIGLYASTCSFTAETDYENVAVTVSLALGALENGKL